MVLKPVVHRDDKGRIKSEGVELDGKAHGPWLFYHRDGRLMERGNYRHGMPEGRWEYYFSNAVLMREGCYSESGQETGDWSQYHRNGELATRGGYHQGRRHGIWRFFNELGSLVSSGRYENGRRQGCWGFDHDVPDQGYELEFLDDRPTFPPNHPGQPEDHRLVYYPMVPGQLSGPVTPFEIGPREPGICFARIKGSARYSYLFRPVKPIEYGSGGGLYISIWERYAYLQFFAWVAVAEDGGIIQANPIKTTPGEFCLLSDPLNCQQPETRILARLGQLDAAKARAMELSAELMRPIVIGGWIEEFPLDH